MMLNKIFLIAIFCIPSAEAGGSKHLTAKVTYACLSLDAIPIPMDSPLASQCCSAGEISSSAPAACRTGVNSIGANAGAGVAFNLEIAKKTLDVAKGLNGSDNDFIDKGKKIGFSEKNAVSADGSKSSDGSGSLDGSGQGGSGQVGSGQGMNLGDNGKGSQGGSSSGNGMGVGSLDKESKDMLAMNDPSLKGPNAAGVYTKVGEGPNSAAAKGADGTMFNGIFGGINNGDGKMGNDGANSELKFGTEKDGAGVGGDSGNIAGSPNDAVDYLSRIDKSASIFKIVSSRYTRESLKKHVGHQ